LIAGEIHDFELPEGDIRSEMREYGNVFGCGLVLDPEDRVWIFFTFNGKFVGQLVLEVRGIAKNLMHIYFQLIYINIKHH
jgi:hypothetical protein